MKEKLLVQGESLQKTVCKSLAAELFLNTHYHLRRNVLNGKLEFAPKTADEPSFRPLTQQALNSIILQAKREAICGDENPKADIVEYVNSEDVILYNPIQEYLNTAMWPSTRSSPSRLREVRRENKGRCQKNTSRSFSPLFKALSPPQREDGRSLSKI